MSESRMIKTGKICVRLAGRFTGRKGKITKLLDDNFVEVTYELSKGEKAKKTNIKHLVILNEKTIKEDKTKKKNNLSVP